jgi:hypothetical protein
MNERPSPSPRKRDAKDRDALVNFRVSVPGGVFHRMYAAAGAAGVNLNDWIRKQLEQATDRPGGPRPDPMAVNAALLGTRGRDRRS